MGDLARATLLSRRRRVFTLCVDVYIYETQLEENHASTPMNLELKSDSPTCQSLRILKMASLRWGVIRWGVIRWGMIIAGMRKLG